MPQRDGKNGVQVVHLGNLTLSGVTPAASGWCDTRGFDSVTLVLITNTVTDAGTAAGFATEMQEGEDSTTAGASAVVDGQMIGLETDLTVTSDSADNTNAGGLGYLGSQRYVRFNLTGTTGTDADVSVVALCSLAAEQPATFIGTSVAAT
jgi:hypothetical protein